MYEALEKSIDHDHSDQLLTDLAEARRKKKRRHELRKTPPGSHSLHPLLNHLLVPYLDFRSSSASDSSHTASSSPPIPPPRRISSTPDDLNMDDDSVHDEQVHSFDDEDIGNDHIPKMRHWTTGSHDIPRSIDESGLDIRFWTRKDVERSKEFMFSIQKRLKTRRIFRNWKRFVGG
ncbi:hypothetical protein Tco_1313347 [Tanacetum coccineum]